MCFIDCTVNIYPQTIIDSDFSVFSQNESDARFCYTILSYMISNKTESGHKYM